VSRAHKFWAGCAIAIGAWEGLAVGTGRLPTATELSRRARRRKVGALAIFAWWLGLGHHFWRA
jgi:hypothetical protein